MQPMMKQDYMAYSNGAGLDALGSIFMIVILADLILVGIWLWKRIVEKK